jgi:hypothetical protein
MAGDQTQKMRMEVRVLGRNLLVVFIPRGVTFNEAPPQTDEV